MLTALHRNPQVPPKFGKPPFDRKFAHNGCRLLRVIVSGEVDSSPGSKSQKPLINRNSTNLKTVATLPVNRHFPVDAFGRKLHAASEAAGASASYLNQASVSVHLSKHAFMKDDSFSPDNLQRVTTNIIAAIFDAT
jgi:hypothetical protein